MRDFLTNIPEFTATLNTFSDIYAMRGEVIQADASIRGSLESARCIDARESRSCAEAIAQLPGPAETIHMLIGGKHSMGHVVPAIVKLAEPAVIDELAIATLTFSRENAADWCALIDAGRIRTLLVICSTYFAKTSTKIYEPALAELVSRGARVLPVRSHAKILAARLSDGRVITAEGSANTRSCRNLEQVTIFGSPVVYAFHRSWMEKLIAEASATEKS